MPIKDPEKRKAYGKKRWLENKERLSLQNRDYHNANKARISEKNRLWREANKAKKTEYQKAYYQANKARLREYARLNYDPIKQKSWNAAYHESNRERLLVNMKVWHAENREKVQAYRKARWQDVDSKNPELRFRKANLKFGLTNEDFDTIYNLQGGGCGVCKRAFDGTRDFNLKRDHDHNTGLFRGLLCNKCNTFLGYLEKRGFDIQPFIDYFNNYPGAVK